jgi:hypothetical protein
MPDSFHMPVYSIEARSFCVALAWCHNFWVLKNADSGDTVAELHGLAYDRIHQKILPIGTTRNHALRVFLFPHDAAYAEEVGRPLYTTRMYGNSRAYVVYRDTDSLSRWKAAVNAMPLLDELDLTYPPFGFNLRTPTVNSNSAYRTFGEIMDVPIYDFPRAFRPGFENTMITAEQIAAAKYRATQRDRRVA